LTGADLTNATLGNANVPNASGSVQTTDCWAP
jgi:hypothetical protein